MKKLEVSDMDTLQGGSAGCEITLGGLWAFGVGACTIPGLQIIGGVVVGMALIMYATKGCG